MTLTISESDPEFGFRPLDESDLPLVHEWLNASPVVDWYTRTPTTLAEVVAKYLPRLEPTSPISVFVATLHHAPVGLFQYYSMAAFPDYGRIVGAQQGWYGIDFFIGDAASRGRGYALNFLNRFERLIATQAADYQALIACPNPANEASLRSLRRAGFVPTGEVAISPGVFETITVRLRRL